MELNCKTAEAALQQAEAQNPGRWAAHVRFAALACRNIAARCDGLSADTAYCTTSGGMPAYPLKST